VALGLPVAQVQRLRPALDGGVVGQRQRLQPAEGRDPVVGQDDVPRLAGQRGLHRRAVIYALDDRGVAAAAQVVRDQSGVFLRILDQQDAERFAHRITRCSPAT
jgi:hypothetical protein